MFIWQNGKIQATNYKMEGEFRHSFVCISLLQTIEVNNQTRKGNDVSIKNNALTGTKTYAARSRLLISPLHLKLTVRNLLHAFGAIWYVNHFPTKKCIRCHNHINISWYHAGKYLHFKKQKLCRMLQVKWTAFNHTTSVKLYTGKNPKKSFTKSDGLYYGKRSQALNLSHLSIVRIGNWMRKRLNFSSVCCLITTSKK